MFYKNEITVDLLNEIMEAGLPFGYAGAAQFLPQSDSKFKLVCLMYDGSWDSRSFEVDLKDDDLVESLDFSDRYVVYKEDLYERIKDIFFENFDVLLRQNHNYNFKNFKDMDTVIFGFTQTLKELDDWLAKQTVDLYISSACGFESEEIRILKDLYYELCGKRFQSFEEKKKFWEDVLILHQEYFEEEDSQLVSFCMNLRKKSQQ